MSLDEILTVAAIVIGVGTPACVGLTLLLRGAGTRVASILLAGALSIVVVFGAHVIGTPWALVVGSEWTVLFLWPLALVYVYPDGRLPSRRWRPMAIVAAVSGAGTLLLLPLQPTLEGPDGNVKNPIQIGAGLEHLLTPVFWACWFGLLAALIGGALSQRARYKAGGPELRRQVLWLAYGAVIPPLWLGGASLLNLFVSISTPDVAVLMLAHGWFAIAVAVAVTRHGLYEIDRLFNRTLVYAVLTALLAGTYALAALLAGQLAGGSAFAAAGGTLAGAPGVPPPRGPRAPPPGPAAAGGSSTGPSPASGSRACGCCATSSTTCGTAGRSRRTSARRSRWPSTTPLPRSSSACPRPAPTPTAAAACSTRCPRTGARARRSAARPAWSCTTPRSSGGPTCCTPSSMRRRSRWRSAACAWSCG